MFNVGSPDKKERFRAYAIASVADVDPRTALKAIRHGVGAIKTRGARERIEAALASLPAETSSAA